MKVRVYYRMVRGYINYVDKNYKRETLERILAKFYVESESYQSLDDCYIWETGIGRKFFHDTFEKDLSEEAKILWSESKLKAYVKEKYSDCFFFGSENEYIKLKMKEMSKLSDCQLIAEINRWYVKTEAEFPVFSTMVIIDLLD